MKKLIKFLILSICLNVYAIADLIPLSPRVGVYCLSCKTGSTTANLRCNENERIAFKGIFYGAKTVDDACKSNRNLDCTERIPGCCVPDARTDCAVTTEKDYYSPCTGRQQCAITFINDVMTCPNNANITMPNYSGVSYYCVPDINIANIHADVYVTGRTVYVMNTNYPFGTSNFTRVQCSVDTVCGKKIKIVALDAYFHFKAGEGCAQELSIKDGLNTIIKDCSHNNYYRATTYYQSESNFLIFTITSKLNIAAFIWMAVMESTNSDEVTVKCGVEAATRAPWCTPRNILPSVVTDKTSGVNSNSPQNISPNGETSTPATPARSQQNDDTDVKAASLSLLVIVLLVTGAVSGVCYYKKSKETKISPEDEMGDEEEGIVVTASSERILPHPLPRPLPDRPGYDKTTGDELANTGQRPRYPDTRTILPPIQNRPRRPKKKSQANGNLPKIDNQTGPLQQPDLEKRPLPKIGSRLPPIYHSDDD